jgi:hypothetical protein
VRIPAAEEDDPKEEVIASREELMDLRARKLQEEIRFEAARAQIAEIEAMQMVDKEADRLAKPGARKNLQLNIFDAIHGSTGSAVTRAARSRSASTLRAAPSSTASPSSTRSCGCAARVTRSRCTAPG